MNAQSFMGKQIVKNQLLVVLHKNEQTYTAVTTVGRTEIGMKRL